MNPSGPAPLPSRWNSRKDGFAVTPTGLVLSPEDYDPNSWQVFVEAA